MRQYDLSTLPPPGRRLCYVGVMLRANEAHVITWLTLRFIYLPRKLAAPSTFFRDLYVTLKKSSRSLLSNSVAPPMKR